MTISETRLGELAARLGIGEPPAVWRAHWAGYEEWRSAGNCAELCPRMPPDAVGVFDLPAGVLRPLEDTWAAVRASNDLADLAGFWHYAIYHLPGDATDDADAWPLPRDLLGENAPLFPLVVLVSGMNHAVEAYARKGLPEEVSRATLSFVGEYVEMFRQREGAWGVRYVGWVKNHVRAELFRLGRLVFRAYDYNWPFRAFRSRRSGRVVTLCEGPCRYRRDGLADGANSIFDPEAWTAGVEIEADTVSGYPVSDDGAALREIVTLDAAGWEQVLAPGDRMIEVHIPAGSKLTPGECADSYRQAIDLFPRLYPRVHFAAFTCWSWLLDPSLQRMLPSESNIVRFQQRFHLLPVIGDESQAYDLVFGDSRADPLTAPRSTSLERAISDYVASGGRMRSAAGFVTWDEAAALNTVFGYPTALP